MHTWSDQNQHGACTGNRLERYTVTLRCTGINMASCTMENCIKWFHCLKNLKIVCSRTTLYIAPTLGGVGANGWMCAYVTLDAFTNEYIL